MKRVVQLRCVAPSNISDATPEMAAIRMQTGDVAEILTGYDAQRRTGRDVAQLCIPMIGGQRGYITLTAGELHALASLVDATPGD